MASQEELARRKAAQVGVTPGAKQWRTFTGFATVEDAVNFANVEPAQQAGEFGVAVDPSAGVTGYYFF